jgi:hypothetical protein
LAPARSDGRKLAVTPRSAARLLFPLAALACDARKTEESASRGSREDASAWPPPVDTTAELPKVHTDIEGLRHYVELPEGVSHVRWISRTRGDGVLGPSDYSLRAFVEMSPAGWNELACDGGAPAAPRSLLLNAADARALLPGNIVVPLSPMLDEFKVPSIPLPAGCVRSASVLNIRSVDRIGNGIWIDAYTR